MLHDTIQTIIHDTSAAACLPYFPLWAAAQFASDDISEPNICLINVRKSSDGQGATIETTNGHYAFSYSFPIDSWRIPDNLRLPAKPFRKFVSGGEVVTIDDTLRATIHGGKASAELLTLPLASVALGIYCLKDSSAFVFPDIPRLWPEAFTNQPNASVAMDPAYLATIMKVCTKAGAGRLAFSFNSPTSPVCMEAPYDADGDGHHSEAKLRFLLMPIQTR